MAILSFVWADNSPPMVFASIFFVPCRHRCNCMAADILKTANYIFAPNNRILSRLSCSTSN